MRCVCQVPGNEEAGHTARYRLPEAQVARRVLSPGQRQKHVCELHSAQEPIYL